MRRRIIICLGFLLALCLLGDAIAMVCLDRSIEGLKRLAESHRIQAMRAELVSGGLQLNLDLHAFLTGGGRSRAEMESTIKTFRNGVRSCNDCHHEGSIAAKFNEIYSVVEAYEQISTELFDRGEAGALRGVRRIPGDGDPLEDRADLLADQLLQQSSELSNVAKRHLQIRSSNVLADVSNAWIVLLGTQVLALIVGGFVALHLERRLTRPVDALLSGIQRARRGDLEPPAMAGADHEFRALADAFYQAYESLNKARDIIIRTEKLAAVGRLAAGVAHEVGNPLASISAIVQVLQRRATSESQIKQFELIMSEIGRISRIVRELLLFSRPGDTGGMDNVDIKALLEHAVSLLRYHKSAKKIQLSCDCEGLPTVRGNADRLVLVFTNLIINAFDALACGKDRRGKVEITGTWDGNQIVLRFEDNGPGMGEELAAKVFEPFLTTKDPGEGTGLGLWVCYQVMRQHKGTIELDSTVGIGTTVVVRLPGYTEGRPDGNDLSEKTYQTRPSLEQ